MMNKDFYTGCHKSVYSIATDWTRFDAFSAAVVDAANSQPSSHGAKLDRRS